MVRVIIPMVKFDKVLNGRPAAREAFLKIKQMAGEMKEEGLDLDFFGVEVLTPSYADELITALKKEYGDNQISTINTDPIVLETLKAVAV